MYLRIKCFHHPDNSPGLLAALGFVGDCLELLDHDEDVAAVLGHLKFFPFGIVEQFYRIAVSFHLKTN